MRELCQTNQELKSGLHYNDQRYMAVGLLWENAIVLVHYIYFLCKVYMPPVEFSITANRKWNRKIIWWKFFVNSYLGLYWYSVILCFKKIKKRYDK